MWQGDPAGIWTGINLFDPRCSRVWLVLRGIWVGGANGVAVAGSHHVVQTVFLLAQGASP